MTADIKCSKKLDSVFLAKTFDNFLFCHTLNRFRRLDYTSLVIPCFVINVGISLFPLNQSGAKLSQSQHDQTVSYALDAL